MPPTGLTIITYNGVTIHGAVTRLWDQEVVYDDSGTDRMMTKYRLKFEGLIHANIRKTPHWTETQKTASSVSGSGGRAIELLQKQIRRALLSPRKILVVKMGDTVMLSVRPWTDDGSVSVSSSTFFDVNNGPKPQAANLSHFVGGTTFRVSFEVECSVKDCDTDNTPSIAASGDKKVESAILSNRWSVSETLDDSYFTTRTIKGVMRLATSTLPVAAARNTAVPPLETGFRRERIDFMVSTSGLECSYTVIDKQVHTSAPWPAVKMQGYYKASCRDGVKFISECRVKLFGAPHSDKKLMIQAAIQIINLKMNIPFTQVQKKYLLVDHHVVDNFGDRNTIEASLTLMRTADNPVQDIHNLFNDMGAPLVPSADHTLDLGKGTYDSRQSWSPANFGYQSQIDSSNPDGLRDPAAWLLVSQVYLQTPCDEDHSIRDSFPTQSSSQIQNQVTK